MATSTSAPPGGVTRLVRRYPFGAFVLATFAVSWTGFGLARATGSSVIFFVAGLGPAIAGALVAWQSGTWAQWWACITRWRVSPWFYVFALGLPVLLYGSTNVVLLALGEQPDWSLAAERLPAYAATWVAALFMGGLEEPGWRGFAQPHLQQRLSPVVATLAVGAVWGLWHLPVEPLAIVVTIPLAFLYTWLLNRSGSALLCVLLHASITPAQDHLSLVADSALVDAVMLGTLVVVAAAVALLTRGRLGLPHSAGGAAA